MSSDEQERLLRLLEAHGQQFLNAFDPAVVTTKRKSSQSGSDGKKKKRRVEVIEKSGDDASEEEEEWAGFSEESVVESDPEDGTNDADALLHQPSVVVFSEGASKAATTSATELKAQKKAFMSSKVSKLSMDAPGRSKPQENSESEDDDKTNAENDALLHRLVHTQILSGSLDPNLNLTAAQRRKALAGRVLEAAGRAKLGKGEKSVSSKERNKHAKHVRDGLLAKQKERSQKELEEAKNMGNYHPALKQLFEDDSSTKVKQKRERGLRMGVGSFSGGVLRLSKSEIASVSGPSKRPPNRKGGRRK